MREPMIVVEFTGQAAPYTVGEKAGFPRDVAEHYEKRGVARIVGPAKPSPMRSDRQSAPGKQHQTREA